jgi:hypothetical protein
MRSRFTALSWLAAWCIVGTAAAQSVPAAANVTIVESERPVAVARQLGGWTFAPVVAGPDALIVAYIAFQSRGERIEGQIDVVWFERSEQGWTSSAWVQGGLIDAVAYAQHRFNPTANHLAPAPIAEAWAKYREAPFDPVEPEPLIYGLPESDPMAQALSDVDNLGDALETLRKSGWTLTPELPAIFARSAALFAGDQQLADDITAMSLISISPGGPSTPIDQCGGVVAMSVALSAATHTSYDAGMQGILSQIADLDKAMLDSAGQSQELGMFCGCSVLYGACTGATGPYVFRDANPSAGSTHCNYCQTGAGTQTYTYTGDTFWCCNPCTGGGTQSCTNCKTCTVEGLGTCPAGPPC